VGALPRRRARLTQEPDMKTSRYMTLLLTVAGLGGLLYGIDVGIIAGALPYLQATFKDSATGLPLAAGQLSFIVAAVLLGSVISTLFAGMLSDLIGRKKMMFISALLFVISIPMIALAKGYTPLVLGRLLQGVSGGLIGVVVPLYLAECLGATNRGKGTGIFQWLLTGGFVVAGAIALYYSYTLEEIAKTGTPQLIFEATDRAWRGIFWLSLPPGILFLMGSLFVAESPRWLFRRGRKEAALAALLRSRTAEQARLELAEMEEAATAEKAKATSVGAKINESLLRSKYVIPFVLACIILACNQATGVNSIIGYNADILIQAGLNDKSAHWGNFLLSCINFLMTIVGVMLVDKKGRKFLLSVGSAGIIASLICVGLVFNQTEKLRIDCKDSIQAMVTTEQKVAFDFNQAMVDKLLATKGEAGKLVSGKAATLVIVYSCGDYVGASKAIRSDDPLAKVAVTKDGCLPMSKVESFFKNPFANLDTAKTAPLKIDNALISPVPSTGNGWLTALFIYFFMAFFAIGPGVCVWLALSELMPTRIRSNGMSVALLINQAVATTIAAVFLPTVGKYGYGTMFFVFAGCTVVYFITAFFFLPETKGKTLEEIEAHFEGKR
jgi:MFS family permease